jgi:hypothetical protein
MEYAEAMRGYSHVKRYSNAKLHKELSFARGFNDLEAGNPGYLNDPSLGTKWLRALEAEREHRGLPTDLAADAW